MRRMSLMATILATAGVAATSTFSAEHNAAGAGDEFVSSGTELLIPYMDAANGRKLYASKGCVVCHAVNGIGGEDAKPLDASTMPGPMNPFDLFAKMWTSSPMMALQQRKELGEQTKLTGQELADIAAFVHNAEEQSNFSEADIPESIRALLDEE